MAPTKRQKRSVKPGSEWSQTELEYFNITIKQERTFEEFFQQKPITEFSKEIQEIIEFDLSKADILDTIDWNKLKSKSLSRFAKNVLAVTKTHKNVESAVDDYAKTLFEILDYDTNDLCIHTKAELPLDMCNTSTYAKPDLCIKTSKLTIKLLVQEDKSYKTDNILANTNAEAQVIAEAIAAFQVNNKIYNKLQKEPIDEQNIPCITLLGTYPIFYLFKVTKQLADAVKKGISPSDRTVIESYKLPIESISFADAMLVQKHRMHILQCYIAFKSFLSDEHK